MIITCASYYGTGSSAITDLVMEYDNVYGVGDYEIRIFQDIDGVRDLEYFLIENYNRHNSGHALKRFKNLVDFCAGIGLIKKYEKIFDGHFKEISYDYIEKLTAYKFKGYWHEDLRDKGSFFYFRKRLLNKIVSVLSRNKEYHINELPKEITLGVNLTEEEFIEYTKEYSRNLIACLNKNNAQNIVVDQLVPPNHIEKYVRYFDDIKVIVVERDPRDVYLLEKEIWKGSVVPHDIETFCRWWVATRAHRKSENLNTEFSLLIQFEDIIYHYDETVERVEGFLGLHKEAHKAYKKYLNPDKSIKNTKLYELEKYQKYSKEIAYIEENLSEYLYRNY